LDELLDDLGRIPGDDVDDPGAETSRAEELQEDWGTERGQLWQVGRHRLLCGDATHEGDVGRLLDGVRPCMMWSDPPYGVEFQSNHRYETPKFDRIQGDEEPLLTFLPHATEIPVWYVCCRWDVAPSFMSAIEAEGHDLQNWIVWYKPAGGMGDVQAQYKPTHETILYASAERSPLLGCRDDDLWEVNRDDVNEYQHPTQKPVQLAARAISNHAEAGEDIYDPFAGSGMSIIAAENEGRTCYAMEIDPAYCAVILERCSEAGMECELISQ
jgi:DNA modification methylase